MTGVFIPLERRLSFVSAWSPFQFGVPSCCTSCVDVEVISVCLISASADQLCTTFSGYISAVSVTAGSGYPV
jgi:hypothetical protein